MTEMDSGRILLVDHSRGALLFQETILRRRRATVTTSLAGSEALAIAREEAPHLILFGYDLFDMSGPEFCRGIRDDERTRSISLLFVCDRGDDAHSEQCLEAGCNDVIFRPLHRQELDVKIAKLTAIPSRRQLRTLTRIEVSLENSGRFVMGRSLNISATGMLIESERVLPGEGRLRLKFFLPGEAAPVQVMAEVLRAEFSGNMARYGLRFVELQPDAREQVERYVQRLRSRELI
jgi:DNA-binding response OmpR family regulator